MGDNRGKRGGFFARRGRAIWGNHVKKSAPVDMTENANEIGNTGDSLYLSEKSCGKYDGWKIYFKNEEFKDNSQLSRQIKLFEDHFKNYNQYYEFENIKETHWFALSMENVLQDENLMGKWSTFKEDLIHEAQKVLGCIGLAMYETIKSKFGTPEKRINVRIKGLTPHPISKFDSMMSSCNGQLVTLTGVVMKIEPPVIKCKWMAFKCPSCNAELAVKQKTGTDNLITPSRCRAGCKTRSGFIQQIQSQFTQVEQTQTVHLRDREMSKTVRTVPVELSQELVDMQCPGKVIIVTGILCIKKVEKNFRDRDVGNNDFKCYIKANSVTLDDKSVINSKSVLSEKDKRGIRLVQSEPSPFRTLVHSLCPNIIGHHFAKAGLLLGLFGGSQLMKNRRSEIHVLLVGDPGMGKSKLLQNCSQVTQRGIFVCGNSTSNVGLSASVGANGSIEVGALALADQGVCCIDEFEKMTSSGASLLEVMEQQHITIMKTGVKATLNARTTIFAAANPIASYYDKSKTVQENLKIPLTLLSRFDLIYFLLDQPNPETDIMVVKHKRLGNTSSGEFFSSSTDQNRTFEIDKNRSLHDLLRLKPNEKVDLVPPQLIQTYIENAKETCHPILTQGAIDTIKEFYKNMHDSEILYFKSSTRQLEALMRMTLARARVDLLEEATAEHVRDVLDIIKAGMIDVCNVFGDDVSQLSRSINSSMNSTRSGRSTQTKKFQRLLMQYSQKKQKTSFTIEELREFAESMKVDDWLHVIENLNYQGYLLKLGPGLFKIV